VNYSIITDSKISLRKLTELLVKHLFSLNKRAQRALGRSPEEKVNGHRGANNREPQGHNMNDYGRGPSFDDVIY